MGAKPGPLCASTAQTIDAGTLCRHQSLPPGPTGAEASVSKEQKRLLENQAYLRNSNVKAFIVAISAAEGGDYNLKFGGVKGKKNDKWQFSDFSTHPGTGSDGSTTAAGMYQINKATWREMGAKMGLTDFSSGTQDLLAVEILRSIHVIDNITSGNINTALGAASRRWAALPQGPDQPGRYDQPYMKYDDFAATYKNNGGTIK
jgi:muramidase (phage lysozyme)